MLASHDKSASFIKMEKQIMSIMELMKEMVLPVLSEMMWMKSSLATHQASFPSSSKTWARPKVPPFQPNKKERNTINIKKIKNNFFKKIEEALKYSNGLQLRLVNDHQGAEIVPLTQRRRSIISICEVVFQTYLRWSPPMVLPGTCG